MKTEIQTGFVIRKHWVVYIKPVFFILLGTTLLDITFSTDSILFFIVLKIAAVFLLLVNIYKMAQIWSVKWTFNSSGIYITQGAFPWNRKAIEIPIVYINEALVSFGLFGEFLNFGHITIRRTQGISSEIKETYLADGKSFSQMLDQYDINSKNKQNSEIFFTTPGKDIDEKLKHLYLLKNNGEITLDEFQEMKKQLMHSH
jgi:hypothetical protein